VFLVCLTFSQELRGISAIPTKQSYNLARDTKALRVWGAQLSMGRDAACGGGRRRAAPCFLPSITSRCSDETRGASSRSSDQVFSSLLVENLESS
jgi:hypothetical protein